MFATLCAILVKIGTVTQEIIRGVSVPFGTRRQKSTYHTKFGMICRFQQVGLLD